MRKTLHLVTLFILFGSTVWSQSSIMGFVKDQSGSAIPFATVRVKGARVTSVADATGSFKIAAPANSKLVVTAVGYTQSETEATDNVTVVLQTSSSTLTDVIVTGTGVATSRKKLGIAVASISGSKLPAVPISSIDQALVGKIAGAQISSTSGNPGDQVNIVLRGINTVQGGTRPMILLDGVEIPFADLSVLDLSQVERVEVVQGAAAATIYGAQGANGVIQIISKKGTKDRQSINISSSYANSSYINAGNFGKASLHPYLTNSNGEIIAALDGNGFSAGDVLKVDPDIGAVLGNMAYRYGADNGGTTAGEGNSYSRYGILDPRNVSDQPYKGGLKYYNHFAQVFESAPSYNNNLSISGGANKVDYNFAMSNNRTYSALLKNNGYVDRTNLTLNVGIEVFKNFTLRSVTNLAYTNNTLHPQLGAPGGNGYGYGTENADVYGVYGFLNTPSFINLQDTITGGVPAAEYYVSDINIGANAFNPFNLLYYSKGDSKKYDIVQSFDATYKVNKFISFNGRYGISYKNENDIWTFYNQTQNANSNYYSAWASYNNGTDNTGELDNFQYAQTKQNLYGGATINLDFAKDLNLNIPLQSTTLAAYDFRKNTYKEVDFYGYSLQLQPPFQFPSTQTQAVTDQDNETFVTYGYLLDEKLDYGNYGGVTAGFRTDYSSAFGQGHKPFTFPHVNGYLNLSSFNFWNSISNIVSNFKLRAAYGKAGIQPGTYQRQPVLNPQPTGNQAAYANPSTFANPGLGVEVTSETEYGTDLTFQTGRSGNWFKNINTSFSYWKRHTDNAIITVVLPPSTGYSNVVNNAITMSSKGWELSVNIPVVTSKNWDWQITTNFGHQTSIINSIVGGDIPLTPGTSTSGAGNVILRAGDKIGQIYGYNVLTSINELRADGKTPFINPADQANYEIINGYVVNKQSKAMYISDEATPFGDPNPKLTSSYINSLTYKGFITLGFQFDWINGSHLYNATNEWLYREGISKDFDKPVTINGQTGAYTAYYASAYYAEGDVPHGVGNDATKSYFYKGSSFCRLRNVSVAVDFAKFVNKPWLKKCQLVLSGRNLFTITKYGGLDPEVNSGNSNSAWDRGNDHSTIPNLKAYEASLNIGF